MGGVVARSSLEQLAWHAFLSSCTHDICVYSRSSYIKMMICNQILVDTGTCTSSCWPHHGVRCVAETSLVSCCVVGVFPELHVFRYIQYNYSAIQALTILC